MKYFKIRGFTKSINIFIDLKIANYESVKLYNSNFAIQEYEL